MNYIELVTSEIMQLNKKYIDNSPDNYDFWEQHIKYVVYEAKLLAERYNADMEIVELGALLHDIALMAGVGGRVDHHTNGAKLADELLRKIGYPEGKINRVVGCVLNHRSSKNATNNEEVCVADADILAHFDNIPLLFNSAFNRNNVNIETIKTWMKDCLAKEYDDLSDRSKDYFSIRYKLICNVLFVNY